MAGRSGRRPGKQDTRAAILAAARVAFAEEGYDGTSIRRVAADAGVDPALVHHYFGPKEALFRAVVAAPLDPGTIMPSILAGDREGIPERLLRTFLAAWESQTTGPGFRALIRSAVSNRVSNRLVREFFTQQVQRRLRTLDSGIVADEIPWRSSLVASQLFGLAMTRYILELPPLAQASHGEVVAAIGPTIARYLFGDLSP
jgi:AcrR family transcriptional regulator